MGKFSKLSEELEVITSKRALASECGVKRAMFALDIKALSLRV